MRYFITNAPLSFMDELGQINWTGWGFDPQQVTLAGANGFQQMEGNKLVSILPVANEELLQQRLGVRAGSEDVYGYYRIAEEAEAIAERDRLKAISDAAEEVCRNTPTDEDIYRAQQLKLLTEINLKLGGAQNV